MFKNDTFFIYEGGHDCFSRQIVASPVKEFMQKLTKSSPIKIDSSSISVTEDHPSKKGFLLKTYGTNTNIKILEDYVEFNNVKFTILAAVNDSMNNVEFRVSIDQVKEMAKKAGRVLICDSDGN